MVGEDAYCWTGCFLLKALKSKPLPPGAEVANDMLLVALLFPIPTPVAKLL